MREVIPGYRQDHEGRTYELERDERGLLVDAPRTVEARPFSFRFFGDAKGHTWHFGGPEVRVHSCGRETCTVCGPARANKFLVVA